ncbi:hypothetical protein KBY58_09625 [Cyanobium sp. HWJ4-Hawea]|uniref:hypothetical protein n=1 Tax=Cyanobium sp. HWJ4-Hawea TaxID=2823713 RepID=UPI0020CF19B5|nr:hypothetical protein [Cyanobium sp. HWJ4-Hawea]MCP9809690.1 hypothetical protein [Cyanobium sp. HWJ4-Hawea]
MHKPNGNLRIALALVALLAAAVSLHVQALRVHGVRPQRELPSTRLKPSLNSNDKKGGTQGVRIFRLLNGR